ncbi:hypothetical protein BHK69_07350 [Bosea vaviloviae]|uniref:Uncharacterized protein n=2 Tax=Bosea vaviloviae TaxID=1526658 RepID=A0A1D7TYW3_9HYPH|nr:hypothetical protein BHK69_07350 [Bosea vaviloviae]
MLAELTEDAMVQITERPSIGGDTRVARAFAEGWLRAAGRLGRPAMEGATREAIVRLRLRNQVQLLAEVGDRELSEIVDSFFVSDQERT